MHTSLSSLVSACNMQLEISWEKKPFVFQKNKGVKTLMLKDVGMTVPKSRETSAVYICSNTGDEGSIFICSKTG